MDALSPTAFFSPSKAKQQRAQAQDWAHVETWLSHKYRGRSIPPFERNEATLSALLALAAANERADEEAELLRRVQEEALKELEEVSSSLGGAFWRHGGSANADGRRRQTAGGTDIYRGVDRY